jgi:phosphoacetylglucosamine mutase
MYAKLASDLKVNLDHPARVIYARDTRASGSTLVASLVAALQATDAEYTDYKILTTPQLHYLVRCINTSGTMYAYGEVSEHGYYEKLANAFKQAMQGKKPSGYVTVDCANGVGGPKLRELMKYLPTPAEGGVEIRVVNDDVISPENLNMNVSCVSYYTDINGS